MDILGEESHLPKYFLTDVQTVIEQLKEFRVFG